MNMMHHSAGGLGSATAGFAGAPASSSEPTKSPGAVLLIVWVIASVLLIAAALAQLFLRHGVVTLPSAATPTSNLSYRFLEASYAP